MRVPVLPQEGHNPSVPDSVSDPAPDSVPDTALDYVAVKRTRTRIIKQPARF